MAALHRSRGETNNAATSRTLVNAGVIYICINYCKFVFLFVLCKYKFNFESFFIIEQLFYKKVSLFNLYVIRVWLNNAATSRILVNPALILILETTVNLNFCLFLC